MMEPLNNGSMVTPRRLIGILYQTLRNITLRGTRGLLRRLLKPSGYEDEDTSCSYTSESGEVTMGLKKRQSIEFGG